MSDRPSTRARILEASRRLFNQRGYARTTLAEIAADVGIAEGNLWYHFRTKQDLVEALKDELRAVLRAHRAAYPSGRPIVDDYVECVLLSMKYHCEHRFLLRDYLQHSGDRGPLRLEPEMAADFQLLRELLGQLEKEELFRRDIPIELDSVARSLFIVSRYWIDHLQEHEGRDDIGSPDQLRGFRHHLDLLLPQLTAAGRRTFEDALPRLANVIESRSAA